MIEREQNIVFIISNARSGSTMVRQLINTHKDIVIPEREYAALTNILNNIEKYGDLKIKENFQRFYNDYEKISEINLTERTTGKNGFYKLSIELWYSRSKTYDIAELYNVLLNYHAKISEIKVSKLLWVGDKSPQHIEEIEILVKYFPKAKYILLTRNPIDIALSQDKFSFRHYNFITKKKLNEAWKRLNKRDNYLLLRRINLSIVKIVRARQTFKKYKIDYIEVNYKEILDDPDLFFLEVSNFLNVENEFNLKHFNIKESQSGVKRGAKELLKNNVNKFEYLLSPHFIKKINKMYNSELLKATDKKSLSANLNNNLKYNHLHGLIYILNIIRAFVPVIGLASTVKLVSHKYFFKKIKKK